MYMYMCMYMCMYMLPLTRLPSLPSLSRCVRQPGDPGYEPQSPDMTVYSPTDSEGSDHAVARPARSAPRNLLPEVRPRPLDAPLPHPRHLIHTYL